MAAKLPVERAPDRPEHEPGRERADGEPGDQAVQPDDAAEIDDRRAHEQAEADEHGNVEAEIAEVGEGRERLRGEALQRDRVVDVAERPREDPGGDPDPRGSPASAEPAHQTGGAGEEADRVVDPVGEDRRHVRRRRSPSAAGRRARRRVATAAASPATDSRLAQTRVGLAVTRGQSRASEYAVTASVSALRALQRLPRTG